MAHLLKFASGVGGAAVVTVIAVLAAAAALAYRDSRRKEPVPEGQVSLWDQVPMLALFLTGVLWYLGFNAATADKYLRLRMDEDFASAIHDNFENASSPASLRALTPCAAARLRGEIEAYPDWWVTPNHVEGVEKRCKADAQRNPVPYGFGPLAQAAAQKMADLQREQAAALQIPPAERPAQ